MEGERRKFDLVNWVVAGRHEVFICDATVAEYIAGRPLKDAGKAQRWQNYWDSFVSLLESVPLDHQVCEKAGELLADAKARGENCATGGRPARCRDAQKAVVKNSARRKNDFTASFRQ